MSHNLMTTRTERNLLISPCSIVQFLIIKCQRSIVNFRMHFNTILNERNLRTVILKVSRRVVQVSEKIKAE